MKSQFIVVLVMWCIGLTSEASIIRADVSDPPTSAILLDAPMPDQVGIAAYTHVAAVQPGRMWCSYASRSYTYTAFLPLLNTVLPWAIINTREAARSFYLTNYVSSTSGILINWTGSYPSCIPGTTSVTFRDAVLRRLNFYRAMAGVPAITRFSDDYNRLSQAAALMMARNSNLSHSPPAAWDCYSSDGYTGAGSSNLALGAYGTAAIDLYIRDFGAGNTAVGHRRWVLYPQTQEMGTGDAPNISGYYQANSLHAWDSHIWEPRPGTRDSYVAWPPAGYVPYQIVAARWSFSYPGATFANAVVSMMQDSTPVAVAQSVPAYGYGENTLVWIPNGMSDSNIWPKPATDITYHITINHVLISGQDRTFVYDVTVFDPQQ